jgi:hypothetical protein
MKSLPVAHQPSSVHRRWWLWLPLLALALGLTLWGEANTSSSSTVVGLPSKVAERSISKTSISTASDKSVVALDMLAPRNSLISSKPRARSVDLFAAGSWSPPPAPVKPALQLPPPAPTAPALPFIYIGKKWEANSWEVFLAKGDQSFIAKEGTVLDTHYRVDKINPPQMSLVYLPLNQTQTLSIGESQ